MTLVQIAFIIIAFLLSFAAVVAVRRWAMRRDLIAVPNERSSHRVPTPTGGGLAIVVVTIAVWLIYGFSVSRFGPLLPLTVGGLLIAAVGWIDDHRPVSPVLRFAVQGFAAAIAVFGFGWFQVIHLPLVHEIDLGWIGIPLTILWIVGLTNAFNFMDGIDGIAGLQAMVAGLGWALIGWLAGGQLVMMIGGLLAVTSFGFLMKNWQPAKIFMGDVGSAFLGYIFAVLPLLFLYLAPEQNKSLSCGVLLLWVFVFDSMFTLLRRALRRENVISAHRSHLYQRLVILGFSHRRVALLYGMLAAVGVFLAVAWFDTWNNYRIYICLLPLMCFGLWAFIAKQERAKRCNVVLAGN